MIVTFLLILVIFCFILKHLHPKIELITKGYANAEINILNLKLSLKVRHEAICSPAGHQ